MLKRKNRITASQARVLTEKAVKGDLLLFEKSIRKAAKSGQDCTHIHISNITEPDNYSCIIEWVMDMESRGFKVWTVYNDNDSDLRVEVEW